ncbi:MAG: hypothetical protein LKH74_00355 [Levilactobacillus sp.]|jgi:hypothetical protein|uniref:hypothetical protein n=1 Tax=Levilactobacillus TaxID=2767886 RepID=UPI0014368D90|nr:MULTISPECIES: hypothetical protein [Levilactobacillus]MCH4123503.1 hypothetical protein [Levilactobacillus sp.]MCI1552359.1 hypothetical protein [Levilactobacillus sp.]MCI1598681.1 hypothetical protein [Levilactobacillus sp.]MCI1606039.1 hypothetical protein [Levilactobacillus sp.]
MKSLRRDVLVLVLSIALLVDGFELVAAVSGSRQLAGSTAHGEIDDRVPVTLVQQQGKW